MLEFLWNNGLVRALLAGFIIIGTVVMAAAGIDVAEAQWTLAAVVGGYYFGVGSTKVPVGRATDGS
jgi:formate/nitrite transporter FocA (FNT family)